MFRPARGMYRMLIRRLKNPPSASPAALAPLHAQPGRRLYDEMARLEEVVRLIRKESQKGNLVGKESLKDMVGIGADEVGSLLARLPNFQEFTDLKSVTDGNGVEYLYSVSEMTDRYMEILLGLKNKNLLELIAETVRYESQKYPRPTRWISSRRGLIQ